MPHTAPSQGLHVAVVGLEFGARFVPIYLSHPSVGRVTICDRDRSALGAAKARWPEASTLGDLDAVFADPSVDAIHLVTSLPDHASQTVRAMEAGKHVAVAVPMGLSFDELDRVLEARVRSGRRYMMMETAAYTRETMFVQGLVEAGAFGNIAYARGAHYQDMSGWPSYWAGLPPMHYATHAIAPILRILDDSASRVRCLGAGRLNPADGSAYGNPYPIESALVEVSRSDTVIELARSLSYMARSGVESFSLYGERRGFEWAQLPGDDHILFTMDQETDGRGRPVSFERISLPDFGQMLPGPLRPYTSGGHGGSHPHLVHEFVSAITEDRAPSIDDHVAANWTATGIAAHLSAMRGGDAVTIPSFAKSPPNRTVRQ